MDKLYKKLMEAVVSDDPSAKDHTHKIFVNISREIYESLEMEDRGDEVGDMIDDVKSDETGLDADVDDTDDDIGFEDPEFETDPDDVDPDDSDDLEDRVIDLEDELDRLQAEFEELMAKEEGEHAEFEDSDLEDDADLEDEDDEFDDEDDDHLSEAIELKKITPSYPAVAGNTKSTVASANKIGGHGKPVNFSSTAEKGRVAPTPKQLGAMSYENSPGRNPKLHPVSKTTVKESTKRRK